MRPLLHPDYENKHVFKKTNLFITIKYCHFVIKLVEVSVHIKTEAVNPSNKKYTS